MKQTDSQFSQFSRSPYDNYNFSQPQITMPPRHPQSLLTSKASVDSNIGERDYLAMQQQLPVTQDDILEQITSHLKSQISNNKPLSQSDFEKQMPPPLPQQQQRIFNFEAENDILQIKDLKQSPIYVAEQYKISSTMSTKEEPLQQSFDFQNFRSQQSSREQTYSDKRFQLSQLQSEFQGLQKQLSKALINSNNQNFQKQILHSLDQVKSIQNYIMLELSQSSEDGQSNLTSIIDSLRAQYECIKLVLEAPIKESTQINLPNKQQNILKPNYNESKPQQQSQDIDLKIKLLTTIALCKKLNPSENQTNTKFTQLKQTLGLPTVVTQDENMNVQQSTEEIIQNLENEINNLCQGFDRRDQARTDINQKMIQAIKQQQFKDVQTLKYEYEQKIQAIKLECQEKLQSEVERIHMQEHKMDKQQEREQQEILLLNSENEKLQNLLNQSMNEIAFYKSKIENVVQEQVKSIEQQLQQQFKEKQEGLRKEIEKEFQGQKQDIIQKMKIMQNDYERQIVLRDKEISSLSDEIKKRDKENSSEYNKFKEIKSQEEEKYEKRLALIKKMHEEQITEMRRANQEREQELQDKIMSFNKQKDAIYQKAKEEAMKEEKKRTDKYIQKLERVKQQELAFSKREQRDTIREMKEQLVQMMQQMENLKSMNTQNQQKQLLATVLTPEQSFYPQKPPGLDIQNLKDSIVAIDSKLQEMETTSVLEKSQNNQNRSQNRLEKYKESMFGKLEKRSNMTMSEERLKTQFKSTLISKQLKDKEVVNQSFVIENVKNNRSRSKIALDISCVSVKSTKSGKNSNQTTVQIQCDLGDQFFESLDYRKCLRCGLNDKIEKGKCSFHPFKCFHKSGAGKYLYSPEWHKCREDCKENGKGCIMLDQHYYGTHLPFDQTVLPKRQKSKERKLISQYIGQTDDKDVMTDVSLLFNPFKTTSSSRSPMRNDRSMRSQRKSSQSKSRGGNYSSRRESHTHHRHSTKTNHQTIQKQPSSNNFDPRQSSPLTQSQLQVTNVKKMTENIKHQENVLTPRSLNSQVTSQLRVSPFKDNLETYLSSQLGNSKFDEKMYNTESTLINQNNNHNRQGLQMESLLNENLASKYLRTDQTNKNGGSLMQILEKSQNDWIKIEDYLKSGYGGSSTTNYKQY